MKRPATTIAIGVLLLFGVGFLVTTLRKGGPNFLPFPCRSLYFPGYYGSPVRGYGSIPPEVSWRSYKAVDWHGNFLGGSVRESGRTGYFLIDVTSGRRTEFDVLSDFMAAAAAGTNGSWSPRLISLDEAARRREQELGVSLDSLLRTLMRAHSFADNAAKRLNRMPPEERSLQGLNDAVDQLSAELSGRDRVGKYRVVQIQSEVHLTFSLPNGKEAFRHWLWAVPDEAREGE